MKKSKLAAFLLGIIPGCGLMYLGYMKKGLQVMSLTAAGGCVAAFAVDIFRMEWLIAVVFLALTVIWFYQMFDTMHTLARMRRLGMEVPDDDGFYFSEKFNPLGVLQNRTFAKILAAVLIIIGVTGLFFGVLDNLDHFIHREIVNDIIRFTRNNLFPALISLALIIGGIRLLGGRRNNKNNGKETD